MSSISDSTDGKNDPESINKWLHNNRYGSADLDLVNVAYRMLETALERGQESYDVDIFEQAMSPCPEAFPRFEYAGPRVTLLLAGSFAVGLLAQDEVVRCDAFGSILSKTFHDMVWEELQKMESYGNFDGIGVYQVVQAQVLKFVIHIHGFVFDLRYYYAPGIAKR